MHQIIEDNESVHLDDMSNEECMIPKKRKDVEL